MKIWLTWQGLALLAVLAVCALAGCASDGDSQNASARPWNSPKSWEGGIPSNLTEGR